MSELVIELSEALGAVPYGHDRGVALREHYDLHRLEDEVARVRVVCPAEIFSISSSFFMGLFGPSVSKCGSVSAFERKFQFVAPDELQSILLDMHYWRFTEISCEPEVVSNRLA